ncbi:MAG: hypothetical protein WCP22_02910 [Chlamydiota bacterium]
MKTGTYFIRLMPVVSMVAVFSSCKTPPRPAPVLVPISQAAGVPSDIRYCLMRLETEGDRNAVLNLSETAFKSIEAWDTVPNDLRPILVDRALNEAIKRIETVYANTPEARKARSVWHDEDSKDFKGEPYERCLVYLLRGLRYYQEGEFENARACFTSGMLQDNLSVEGEYNADMGTFEYLISLCDTRLGEREAADEAWQRAVKIWEQTGPPIRISRPKHISLAIPEIGEQGRDTTLRDVRKPQECDNLLVVAFVGEGPRKSATGSDNELLLIERGAAQTTRVEISAPWFGKFPDYETAAQTDDIGYQATTRGGRLVDEINKKKAVTKHATENTGYFSKGMGKAAMTIGLQLAMMGAQFAPMGSGAAAQMIIGGGSTAAAGVGAQVLGQGLTFASKKMKTKADTRMIGSLPGFIHLWSGRVVPGRQLVAVKLYDEVGRCIGESYQDVAVPYGRGNALAFMRCP